MTPKQLAIFHRLVKKRIALRNSYIDTKERELIRNRNIKRKERKEKLKNIFDFQEEKSKILGRKTCELLKRLEGLK